jgi:hypothetical protein
VSVFLASQNPLVDDALFSVDGVCSRLACGS